MAKFVLPLLFTLWAAVVTDSAKILGLFPITVPSHLTGMTPLIRELAGRGHEITFISTTKPNLELPNVKEIEMVESQHITSPEILNMLFEDANKDPITRLYNFRPFFSMVCKQSIGSQAVRVLLQKGMAYDLVLVHAYFNECTLKIAPQLGKHLVMVGPCGKGVMVSFPSPSYSSFVSNSLFKFPRNMTFFQRLQNSVGTFILKVIIQIIRNDQEAIVSQYVPNTLSIYEAMNRVSLLLLNTDPVLQVPYPTTPRIQSIYGMHLEDAKPLRKELSDFIDGAGDDGFIFFSLGSVTPSELLPEKFKQAFISAFSRLKQRIIWKYNGTRANLPNNIILSSWFPQRDILGHPKIRLFISHGGLLSSQEAIYHGCPMLGMPIFWDQHGNVAKLRELGIGEELASFSDATADDIYDAITNIILNPKYQENAKKYSAIIRDQPQAPEKRGAFWVEYVLRHKGAAHLRSAGDDQTFVQYYLIDVLSFLLVVMAVTVLTFILMAKYLFRLIVLRKKKESKIKAV